MTVTMCPTISPRLESILDRTSSELSPFLRNNLLPYPAMTTASSLVGAPTYRVIGVNDDEDFCMCCGKTGLTSVVWIQFDETGEIRHFGTTCALKPQKGFCVDKEIKRAVVTWKHKVDSARRMAWKQYRAQGGTVTALYEDGKYGRQVCGWKADDISLYQSLVDKILHP